MRTTIFAVLLVMSLMACNNDTNQYDSGYEAAWNGEKDPSSIWSTKKQRNGYQDGLDDADMYDDGYYDGKNINQNILMIHSTWMDLKTGSRKGIRVNLVNTHLDKTPKTYAILPFNDFYTFF